METAVLQLKDTIRKQILGDNDIMRKRIRGLLSNSIVSNSFWLLVLQGFNMILPMITIPYITRVLGPETYGTFSAAQNWTYYFQVIVEYGFGLWGARNVALIKNDEEISDIFSEILTARVMLCIISFVVMCLVSWVAHISTARFVCQIILYSMIVGSMLQLVWLFQGKEKMRPITIVNALARLLSVALIFAFVKNKESLYLYTFFYSITYIISAVLMIGVAKKIYGLHLVRVGFKKTVYAIKDAWYIFISSAFIKVFSGIALSILTIISTDYFVGIYSAIYKIPYILVMLFSPISQAIYPNVSKRYNESFSKGLKFVNKIAFPIISVFVGLSVLIAILKDQVIGILFGKEYVQYSSAVVLLLLQTIFAIFNNFAGVQTLVASGNQKGYSRAFSRAAIFMAVIYGICIIIGKNTTQIYLVSGASALSEAILSVFILIERRKMIYELTEKKNGL